MITGGEAPVTRLSSGATALKRPIIDLDVPMPSSRLGLLAAAALLSLAGIPSAHANLVTNGDFETGDISGWIYTGTVGLNLYVTSQFAHSGANGAGIGPNGFVATLSQSVSTAIGEQYVLDFWLALAPPAGTGSSPNSLALSLDGFSTNLLALTNAAPFGFTHYSYGFTATQASTTVAFAVRNDPWGFSLDDVAVNRAATDLPEPASLALCGVALAGLIAARRRRA